MITKARHSWSEGVRYEHHTDRCCWDCGLIKRTRHEEGRHWIEFHRDGVRVEGSKTPPCTGRAVTIPSEGERQWM